MGCGSPHFQDRLFLLKSKSSKAALVGLQVHSIVSSRPSWRRNAPFFRPEEPKMTLHSDEVQSILKRLEKVEAENRRLKICGTAVAVVVAAFVLMGQASAPPKVVEAERFVLKDSSGNIRGWLGLFGEGSELTLGNSSKQPMMTLKVSDDASDLHFYGSQHSGMNIGVEIGEPAIAMAGPGGRAGIEFHRGGPGIAVEDSNGASAIMGVPKSEENTAGMEKTSGGASFLLLNRNKKVIWKAH